MALFGPDRLGWRRMFLRVKRTSQLRAPKSENDPGCVKTPCCWYDFLVILREEIDEALR